MYIMIVIQAQIQIASIAVVTYLTGWILVHGFVYNPVTKFLSFAYQYDLKLYMLYTQIFSVRIFQ